MRPNASYYGDCMDWMRQWDDQSTELIYLDPHSTLRQPTTNHATKMEARMRGSGVHLAMPGYGVKQQTDCIRTKTQLERRRTMRSADYIKGKSRASLLKCYS